MKAALSPYASAPAGDSDTRVSTAATLLQAVMANNPLVKVAPETGKINLSNVALLLAAGPVILAIYKALKRINFSEAESLIADVKEAEDLGVTNLDSEVQESAVSRIQNSVKSLLGTKVEEPVASIAVVSRPKPPANLRLSVPKAEVDNALRTVALKQGIDYSMLYALAGAESSFRSDAKATTSSATGLMQFTDGTWKDLVTKHKLPYTLQDRNDPVKAATVASFYIKGIQAKLKPIVGTPTVGDVYLAYFLGPSGAARFLKALKSDPTAFGADLFPAAATANKTLFYGNSGPLTLAQTYGKLTGKVEAYYVASMSPEDTPVKSVRVAAATPTASPQSVTRDEAPAEAKVKVSSSSASRPAAAVSSPTAVASPTKVVLTPTEAKPSPATVEVVAESTTPEYTLVPPASKANPRPQVDYVRTKAGVLVAIPT